MTFEKSTSYSLKNFAAFPWSWPWSLHNEPCLHSCDVFFWKCHWCLTEKVLRKFLGRSQKLHSSAYISRNFSRMFGDYFGDYFGDHQSIFVDSFPLFWGWRRVSLWRLDFVFLHQFFHNQGSFLRRIKSNTNKA